MGQHFLDLQPDARQFGRQQLGRAGAELGIFVHEDRGFGGTAGCLVDFREAGEGVVHAFPVAGRQPEHVLEAAAHDGVGHPHIDQKRRVVFGGGLGRRQRDAAGETAHIRRHTVLLHAFDLAHTHFGARLRIAQQGFEPGAAHRLDATGSVDFVDGHLPAHTRLRAAIRQRSADRMQQPDLHRLGLRQQKTRRAQHGTGSAGLENQTTRHMAGGIHGCFPRVDLW